MDPQNNQTPDRMTSTPAVPSSPPITPSAEQPVPVQQQPAPFAPGAVSSGQPSISPAPVQVSAPMQPSQMMAPQSVGSVPGSGFSSKKPNKGLIIGLIAGGIALLIGLVLLYVFVFAGPSKSDYSAAVDKLKAAQDSYDSISLKLNSDAVYETGDVDISSEIESYKSKSDALKNMKAFRDSKAKKKYDAFVVKNTKFINAALQFSEDATKMKDTRTACGSVSPDFTGATVDTIVSRYDSAIAPCLTAVKGLEKSKSTVVAKFAKDFQASIATMREALAEMVAATKEQNSVALSAARTKLTDAANEFSDSASNFKTDYQKSLDDAQVKDEASDLLSYLTDKANSK